MNKKIFYLIILFSFSIFVSASLAQEKSEGPKQISNYYGRQVKQQLLSTYTNLTKKISVDFKNMDIVDALKFLSYEGGLNIITGKGVAGAVNLLLENVAIIDIFDILLATNELAYYMDGDIINVVHNDAYKLFKGENFYDQRQNAIYQLKYASAAKVGELLGNIKSDIGKIVFDDGTGMIIITDTFEKIKEMNEVISKADIPTVNRILPVETKIYELKYAKTAGIKEEITAALSQNIGTIRTDERTNTFVITDLPHKQLEISKIIEAFDRKTREVFIEAKIVQVSLSDSYKWGVDWTKVFSEVGGKKNLTITPEINMPSSLTTFGKVTFAKTGNESLTGVLELLESVGETKILSNPHIATEEGKEATINVITKQPYSESTTTTTDAATTSSTEFIFVDVGVKLNVTPTINSDGFISMLIKPEVSSITSFFPDSTSANRVPVIETANAEATVTVKDGITIIIAGMIKDEKTKSTNKIPLLGDIPVLGKLFSNASDEVRRTETIVFLTPTIISGDKPYVLERDRGKPIKDVRQ